MNGYYSSWYLAQVLLGGVSTLAIFSFLIRENVFYRFFEHLFIGIASGLGIILSIKNFLWPKILVPLLGLDIVTYPDGTLSGEYNPWVLLYIAPMLFGLLYYFLYSTRYAWLAKIVIGFTLGMSGGLAFKAFFNGMMPQLVKSFKPLVVFQQGVFDVWASIENVVFVFTLLAVMYYFFVSLRVRPAVLESFGKSGRWLMMICFGAFFGSTVMARMALLVERLQFLIVDWWRAIVHLMVGAA